MVARDDRKLRELILYIAQHSEDDPHFGATKLNKILFYADFIAYARLGRPITGSRYIKMEFGPVLDGLDLILAAMEEDEEVATQETERWEYKQKRTVALRDPLLDDFTANEIATVQQAIDDLQRFTAKGVSDLSHSFVGWQVAEAGETIPYETALVYVRPRTQAEARYADEIARTIRA